MWCENGGPALAARTGWVCLAAMALAQVSSSRTGPLVVFVWLIVALLAASSVSFTAVTAGWLRAAGAAAAAFALGLAAEWAGTHTAYPFGGYRYTGRLPPAVATVPLLVPLAWAAMGLPAYAVGTAIARSRAGRILAGAVALTAWDLFLDPQMLRYGFWRWAHPGPYEGVPLTNFAGWLVVSAVLMTVLGLVLDPPARRGPVLHRGLLAGYTVMAVMETVGFAAIFPHGRVVALAGAAGMGGPAALAWARVRAGTASRRAAVNG